MGFNSFDEDFSQICRLTYEGDLENMSFAIYKYSSKTYYNFIDDTIEGAMKAGIKAYM